MQPVTRPCSGTIGELPRTAFVALTIINRCNVLYHLVAQIGSTTYTYNRYATESFQNVD